MPLRQSEPTWQALQEIADEMIAPVAVVVDDDQLVIPVLTTVLADAGFKILSATDSESGLRLLRDSHGRIDLLFTDVMMPGSMDGIGLAHAAEALWPSVAIVISSGRVVPKSASLPPAALFLPKPFGADHIVRFTERAMARKGTTHLLRGDDE